MEVLFHGDREAGNNYLIDQYVAPLSSTFLQVISVSELDEGNRGCLICSRDDIRRPVLVLAGIGNRTTRSEKVFAQGNDYDTADLLCYSKFSYHY